MIVSITAEDVNKIIEPKINFDICNKLLNENNKSNIELLFNVDTKEYFILKNQFIHKIDPKMVSTQFKKLKTKNISSNDLQPYIVSNQMPDFKLNFNN